MAKWEGLDVVLDCVPGLWSKMKSGFKAARGLKRARAARQALPGLESAADDLIEGGLKNTNILNAAADEARIAAETERAIAGNADEVADGAKWVDGKAAEDAAVVQNVSESAGEQGAKELGETAAANATKAGTCSFEGETRVLMADGTTKPIDEIRVGDEVLAQDPETGERSARKVTHLWVHDDEYVRLEIDGSSVLTTANHPFWDDTDQRWERADELSIGDMVLTADGHRVRVGHLQSVAGHGAAYNLTVEGLHTYHVLVGHVAVLVHNTCDNFGISEEAENIAKHANENAYRPGNGLDHNIPGVDPKALDAYVDGVLEGNVPGVVGRYAENGRAIYWDPSKGAVVIVDGAGGGSVYIPTRGFAYYKDFPL
jgi:Pretoxin HINT domain